MLEPHGPGLLRRRGAVTAKRTSARGMTGRITRKERNLFHFDDLMKLGSEKAVKDGDIMLFRFNV